jgi:hypothetical protein
VGGAAGPDQPLIERLVSGDLSEAQSLSEPVPSSHQTILPERVKDR